MVEFNWNVDLGNLIAVGSIIVAAWRLNVTTTKVAALRDQKIDIILFGTIEIPGGIVGDVKHLKRDMYHDEGKVNRIERRLHPR